MTRIVVDLPAPLGPTKPVTCPGCVEPATRVHDRYWRRLQDLAWCGRPVQVVLRVRRFICDNPACVVATFAEHGDDAATLIAAADAALATDAQRAWLVGCDPSEACLRSFVARFGRRAFRRSLDSDEIDAWTKAARTFAATHGPQFEAATLGRIVTRLVRHTEYAALARTYAAEADKLAAAAGIPESMVWRFRQGADMKLETAGRLAEVLGVELVRTRRRTRPGRPDRAVPRDNQYIQSHDDTIE